jgi:sulfite reductase (NADPH) flavoprotein alpha-component
VKSVAGQLGIGAMLLLAIVLFARWQDFSSLHIGQPGRAAWAGAAAAGWATWAVAVAWPRRRLDARQGPNGILVVHASQTGFATELAERTAGLLRAGGMAVDLREIAALTAADLSSHARALFVASTTGEGDAPDNATAFQREVMRSAIDLHHLTYAVLALGDRDYEDFCAFGRDLDRWLRERGAMPWFDRVDVDNGDDGALRHWQGQVTQLAGAEEQPDWSRPAYQSWRLRERRLLNPGSAGAPCFHVSLVPDDGMHLRWDAGDIAEIGPRRGRGHDELLPHREYSVASVPADGELHLVVRQQRSPDGVLGAGSGWLTALAQEGDTIDLRVRRNAGFHAPADARPVLLIGNGTGIAALRALLKTRVARGHMRNWLVFGERHERVDRLHVDELENWRADGAIERLDLVWSRESRGPRYVQDRLRGAGDALRCFIGEGASIYVCGSLAGMAPGVDAALREVLGDRQVEALAAAGRYRRDVY